MICECTTPQVSSDSLRCVICKRLLKSIDMTATKPKPEQYYRAASAERMILFSTSKDKLVISITRLSDIYTTTMILEQDQIKALKGFLNDIN